LRLATLFLGMPVEAFLGLTIMSMSKPIAPGYTVSDTHTGGATFWISSMFVMTVAIIVSLRQWMQAEERKAARLDAALDAALDLDRAIAAQRSAERPKPVEAG
jgi:cytochrome c oxidase assembly factor CtaG